MKDFIISTDSTADLPESYCKENNVFVHPLYYSIGNTVYGGDNKLDPKDFYTRMRAGEMPTTMASNPEFVNKSFSEQIKNGTDVLHISFSSALSGSYNNAAVNARELMEQHKESKIIVIDSLSASLGQGLLVDSCVNLKKAGKTIDEIASWVEENKLHLCHEFTVDDLFNLHRGGRVSKTAAILGTLINVKPVLHMDNLGRLIPLYNVRGRKKALIALVDAMEKSVDGYEPKNTKVFICHADAPEDAQFVADLVKERFGIDNHLIGYTSPTIGAHSGPGTIALFYYGRGRELQ
jgi:DegV family protein with EDD domain